MSHEVATCGRKVKILVFQSCIAGCIKTIYRWRHHLYGNCTDNTVIKGGGYN